LPRTALISHYFVGAVLVLALAVVGPALRKAESHE
jgi:hypothetical protein